MAWAPSVVSAYAEILGEPHTIHTAIPPFSAGGEHVDVAEFHLDDGSVVYGTAGLSEGGGWTSFEFVLHAAVADPSLHRMLASLGGSTRGRSYEIGGTVPLAGSADEPAPFHAVGFLYGGRRLPLGETNFAIRQVVGLTAEELEVARRDGLYTVEAAWDLDGVGRTSEVGRATSPHLAELTPVRPDPSELRLSPDGREVMEIAIRVDHDGAEGIRGYFTQDDAVFLADVIGKRLPHPSQLACLLHALMDLAIPELSTVCMRMLQLSPDDYMAGQYYADALAILAVIDGDNWEDAYFGFEADFEAACAEAERRRQEAGLEVLYGRFRNPFMRD